MKDFLIVAVADGVSSGQYSQMAAETASRSACKLVGEQLQSGQTVNWLQLARRVSLRIVEEAEYRRICIPSVHATVDERLDQCRRAMATTLVVAFVQSHPDNADGAHRVELGLVAGDSSAYVRRSDALELMTGGKMGAILDSSVQALPGSAKPGKTVLSLHPGEALILVTDGLGDPIGDGTNDVGHELAERWAQPPALDRFLLDVNFYRKSFDDDRTAVGIWARP